MGILKDGMNIKCRTQDEFDIFFEIAKKEGYKWRGHDNMEPMFDFRYPMTFQLGSEAPRRVMYATNVNYESRYLTNVEADQLFHNLIISKRAKYGIS